MRHPLVAIPADYLYTANVPKYCVTSHYVTALCEVAGVIPIIVPCFSDCIAFEDFMDHVDGLLISGAVSNVHPSRYNESVTSAHHPFDERRDKISFQLIASAMKRKMPILGICRGLQELNVYLGGTLETEIHEKPARLNHSSPASEPLDERYKLSHKVKILPGGLLEKLLQMEETAVNSLHRQAIARLAPGLRIEAVAPDQTIEAISLDRADQFVLGVQWHPEYWATSDPISNKIIKGFGQEIFNYYNRGKGRGMK